MKQARGILFLLLLAASLAVLAYGNRGRQQSAQSANVPINAAGADLAARTGVANIELSRGDARITPVLPSASRKSLETAIRQYQAALRTAPDSSLLINRTGILIGFLHGPEAAWQWFQQHPAAPEKELWRAAYAPDPLPPDARDQALSRLKALPDNWYRELVRSQIYRKAGETARANTVLLQVRERVRPGVGRYLLFSAGAFFGGLLGLLIWLLFLRRGGTLPRAPRDLPFAGLSRGALGEAFVLWFFVLTVGGWALRQWLAGPAGGIKLALLAMLGILLGNQIFAGLVGGLRLAAAGHARRSEARIFTGHSASEAIFADIAWGITAYLAAVPLLVLTAGILNRLLPNLPTPPNPAATLALGTHGPWQWFLLTIVVAITGPLFEEMFFRGVLYSAMRKRAGVALSVFASAAAFAMVHPQLPLGFLPILALGAVFAYVVEVRRSLVPSIVAHMLNNAAILFFFSFLKTP